MLQPKKKIVKKKSSHPNDDYKDMVDPATGKKGTIGGEGKTPPLGKRDKAPKSAILPKRTYVGGSSAKNGKTMKKAKNGTLQPMGKNSRKVSEGKYVSEDGNYKMKFKGGSDTSAPTSAVQRRTLKGFLKGAPKAAGKMALKSGGSMKKCKYGCK
jgi:hypothetical protein